MMKKIKFLLLGMGAIALLAGCKKSSLKKKEYFQFYANGEKYRYEQVVDEGLFGSYKSLGAGRLEYLGTSYMIVGEDGNRRGAPGRIEFILNFNFPDRDTVIIDGVYNVVTIRDFLGTGKDYDYHEALPPGRIVFTERSRERLKGTFEFQAESYRNTSLTTKEYTDTIMHITKGEFSIIPGS